MRRDHHGSDRQLVTPALILIILSICILSVLCNRVMCKVIDLCLPASNSIWRADSRNINFYPYLISAINSFWLAEGVARIS